jgi:hypothetical protein
MDELAVVQPHGPDRIVAATTRMRTGALVAVMGRVHGDDSSALSVLVRAGGMLTVVTTVPEGSGVWFRSRRFRPIVVPFDAGDSFPANWNQTILRWQRSARLPLSASRAQA